jgi:hypothetical protein
MLQYGLHVPLCKFWLRIYDFATRCNPKYFQCLLDEDMIRRVPWHCMQHVWHALTIFHILSLRATSEVKAIVLGVHPVILSKRALEHYCVAVSLRWVKGIYI